MTWVNVKITILFKRSHTERFYKSVVIWRGYNLVTATRKYFQEAGCIDGTILKCTNVKFFLSIYLNMSCLFYVYCALTKLLKTMSMVKFKKKKRNREYYKTTLQK